jgi:hypothetical protein
MSHTGRLHKAKAATRRVITGLEKRPFRSIADTEFALVVGSQRLSHENGMFVAF